MKQFLLFLFILLLGLKAQPANPEGIDVALSPTVDIKIFPNPNTSGTLKITASSAIIKKIQITNITGHLVLEKNFNLPESTQQLNVNTLTNGIYLVKIITGDGQTFTQKLIITKD